MSTQHNISQHHIMNKTSNDTSMTLTDMFVVYYPFAVIFLGSMGNFLSVLVFFGTKLRNQSSSYYLSSLAISDTIFLLTQLVARLNKFGIKLFNMYGFCQFFIYLTQICSFISVWLVVLFTSERFIAVRYPLHRSVVCTVYRAKIVLGVLLAIASIAHVPYLLISGPINVTLTNNRTQQMCDVDKTWYHIYVWLNFADVLVNMVIPFCLIVVFNCMICRSVCRLARIRRTMTLHPPRQRRQSSSAAACTPQQQHNSQHASQIKVTEMLLVVSTVFLCLNLPSYVFRLWITIDKETPHEYYTLQYIANQMYNTNFGINFFLYCVSGQNFRRALAEFWKKRRRPNNRFRDTQITTVLSEFSKSGVGSKQTTLNGTWKEVHELIPIAHSQN